MLDTSMSCRHVVCELAFHTDTHHTRAFKNIVDFTTSSVSNSMAVGCTVVHVCPTATSGKAVC